MSQPPTLAEQLAALGGEKITDVKTTSSSTSSSLLETLGYAAFGLGAAAVALGVIQYTQKSKSSSKSSSSRQSNKSGKSTKSRRFHRAQLLPVHFRRPLQLLGMLLLLPMPHLRNVICCTPVPLLFCVHGVSLRCFFLLGTLLEVAPGSLGDDGAHLK